MVIYSNRLRETKYLLQETLYRDQFALEGHQDHHRGPTPSETQYDSDATEQDEELE